MIIFIQYPLADLRSFLPAEVGRLGSPIWPTPIPDLEFVRNFGAIDYRWSGGITGWVAESRICKSKNAIRFVNQLRFEGPYEPLNLKVGGRHFYFDGLAVAKFEIVLVANPYDIASYPRPINELLQQVLDADIRFPKLRQGETIPTAKIRTAAKLLAQLYLASSTRKSQLGGLEARWLRHGEPLVLLETYADETPILPPDCTEVAALDEHVQIKHWWLRGPQKIGVWMTQVQSDSELPRIKLRELRILLMRLHAEQQALQYVLKAISDGEISPASEGGKNPAADRLQRYLSIACKRIFRMSKSAEKLVEPEQVGEVVRKSFDVVSPGQRDALLQKLEQYNIRPQVEEPVKQIVNNYVTVGRIEVDQSKHIDNKGQMIYADGNAQVSQVTMNQNVQAPMDLKQLSEALGELLEKMKTDAEAAQHPDEVASVKQAAEAAKSGDQNKTIEFLKAAGKWVLDFAEKVGSDVLVAVLKAHLGAA